MATSITGQQRQVQHLVEVTIVKKTLPIDAKQATTHQRLHIGLTKVFPQQVHIFGVLALRQQYRPKTTNGHIRNRHQVVKANAKSIFQLTSVLRLQRLLRRRQHRPHRIIGQIEYSLCAVAKRIELLQCLNTRIVNTFATLRFDILLHITR